MTGEVEGLIAPEPGPRRNFALPRGATGFGETPAAISSAEPPDVADFTPKAPAAFAVDGFAGQLPSRLTLSPWEHRIACGDGVVRAAGGPRYPVKPADATLDIGLCR